MLISIPAILNAFNGLSSSFVWSHWQTTEKYWSPIFTIFRSACLLLPLPCKCCIICISFIAPQQHSTQNMKGRPQLCNVFLTCTYHCTIYNGLPCICRHLKEKKDCQKAYLRLMSDTGICQLQQLSYVKTFPLS